MPHDRPLSPTISPVPWTRPIALAVPGARALLPLMALATLLPLASLVAPATAQVADRPFGTLREQAAVRQEWLELRLERVLPRLMREHGVDMWIVPVREYNEDPAFFSLVSPTTMAARRRTIYVFHDRGAEAGIERIAIGGTSQGGLYAVVRDPQAREGAAGAGRRLAEPFGPEQWQLLPPIVRERDPATIAVNISHVHHFADGLTAGEWEQLRDALGPEYASRVVRRPLLAVQYIEERLPEMLATYVRMQELVHRTIATAFSRDVITPGVTTTQDVVWWLRQRTSDLGLGTWFQPSVTVQRHGVVMADSADPVIRPGDVLHTDYGITVYGLNTDTQHMGYVLHDGEAEAPPGLRAALGVANRLQDILLEQMDPGRTGNQVLAAARARMTAEGIDGTIYTHPIGDHGHGAGPTIGLWDRQEGVAGRGDLPLRPDTWFAIELQATVPIPEWNGQPVRMALEEEARLDSTGARRWVLRRQERFHLVR
jgi:Xaa-Pro aminopeptidase